MLRKAQREAPDPSMDPCLRIRVWFSVAHLRECGRPARVSGNRASGTIHALSTRGEASQVFSDRRRPSRQPPAPSLSSIAVASTSGSACMTGAGIVVACDQVTA